LASEPRTSAIRETVAEGMGFEPMRGLFTPYPLSRRAHSASMRSLHPPTGICIVASAAKAHQGSEVVAAYRLG
jgi:hypothetical protein